MMHHFLRIWIVITCFFLAACIQKDLNIIIEYDDVDGLVSKAPVLYKDEKVGEVTEIIYTNNGKFEVYVNILNQHQELARKNTGFVISAPTDPASPKFIELVAANSPGEALVAGEKIRGISKLQAMANNLKQNFSETLDSVKTAFNQTVDNMSHENLDVQLEYLEREIDRWLAEAGSMSEKTKQRINNDVLPNIEKQFSRMQDKMKEMELDKTIQSTMEDIEEKLEALSSALQE